MRVRLDGCPSGLTRTTAPILRFAQDDNPLSPTCYNTAAGMAPAHRRATACMAPSSLAQPPPDRPLAASPPGPSFPPATSPALAYLLPFHPPNLSSSIGR